MQGNTQQRSLRKILNSPYTLGVVVVLVMLLFWSVFERGFIAGEVRDRREQVENDVESLRQRQVTLEADVEYLESERGQEAEMRRQFDVALPGEQVVVIVDDQTSTDAATIPVATTSPQTTHWYEFWR